jgi:hypothetical protein
MIKLISSINHVNNIKVMEYNGMSYETFKEQNKEEVLKKRNEERFKYFRDYVEVFGNEKAKHILDLIAKKIDSNLTDVENCNRVYYNLGRHALLKEIQDNVIYMTDYLKNESENIIK